MHLHQHTFSFGGTATVPPPQEADRVMMSLALSEAARGLGRTAPNPPVGCVIARGGEVLAVGHHVYAERLHAEAAALASATERGVNVKGATAYVTLEPCSHHGRTPPCADALVAAGISRVVVAALDPNPKVNGGGVARMRAAGLRVEMGSAAEEAAAKAQQAGFRRVMTEQRPQVVFKYAMTLDGCVAANGEGGGAVSGPAARELVMRWRNESDGIAVGSGTLRLDDPQLSTRGLVGGRSPRPVLFDRDLSVVQKKRALRAGAVVVCGPDVSEETADILREAGADILRAGTVADALSQLASLHIHGLLLEGGPRLAGAFYAAGLIDEVRAFISPRVLGGGLSPLAGEAASMSLARGRPTGTFAIGDDVLMCSTLNDIP